MLALKLTHTRQVGTRILADHPQLRVWTGLEGGSGAMIRHLGTVGYLPREGRVQAFFCREGIFSHCKRLSTVRIRAVRKKEPVLEILGVNRNFEVFLSKATNKILMGSPERRLINIIRWTILGIFFIF